MTELKKIELTEEALDQVSGGKITAKKVAIAGVALAILAIGGGTIYAFYHWRNKKKKGTPDNEQAKEVKNLNNPEQSKNPIFDN